MSDVLVDSLTNEAPKRSRKLLLRSSIAAIVVAALVVVVSGSSHANAELIVQKAATKLTEATAASFTLTGTFMPKDAGAAMGSIPLTGEGYVQAKPRTEYVSLSMSLLGQSFDERVLVNGETGVSKAAVKLGGEWTESTVNMGATAAPKYSMLTGPLDALVAGGFTAVDKGTDAHGHRYDYSGTLEELGKAAKRRHLSAQLRAAVEKALKQLKGSKVSGSLWIDDQTGRLTQLTTVMEMNSLTGSITETFHDWNVIKDPQALFTENR